MIELFNIFLIEFYYSISDIIDDFKQLIPLYFRDNLPDRIKSYLYFNSCYFCSKLIEKLFYLFLIFIIYEFSSF